MGCEICGRGSCAKSFHSIEQQERHERIEAGECEDCIDKEEELNQLRADLADERERAKLLEEALIVFRNKIANQDLSHAAKEP